MTSDPDQTSLELRDSEEKFRPVSASAQDAIIVIDQDGNITDWNDAAHTIFGYAATEVIGRDLHALLVPSSQRGAAVQGMQRFRASGTGAVINKTQELSALRRDGSAVQIELSVSAVPLRGRWHAIGIVRDISGRKRAEEALAASEKKFRDLVETVSDWVWQTDEQGAYTYCSPKVRALLGYEPSELIGRSPFDLMPAAEARRVGAIFGPLSAQRLPLHSLENVNLHKDGHEVVLETSAAPVFDTLGRFKGYRGVDRDVTERKQAQERLRESEQQYRMLVASMAEGVTLQDADSAILAFNESAERILGLSADQLQGKTSFDPGWRSIHEDGSPFVGETHPVVITLRSGLPQSNVIMGIHKPDGTLTWISINTQPIFEPGGTLPVRVVASFRDITERRRMEQALRESEQRLRLHVEETPLGVIEWDTQFRVASWNRAAERIFGYTAAEAMGKHAGFIVAAEARDAVDGIWRQLLAAKGGMRSTNGNVVKDGRTILCEWYNTPLVTSEGKVIGVASLVEDVTQTRQAAMVCNQLAAIVQSSHDAIIGGDLNGVVVSWNPGAERIYGYRAEEIVGKPVSPLFPEDRQDECDRLLERVAHGEAVLNFETEHYRKDGKRIDVALDLSPMKEPSGRIAGASIIARDIGEKKRSERALRNMNRALQALSACNETLIHAADEVQFLRDICRVIIDVEGYRLAWVGYVEHDANKTVRPVAQCGYAPGYIEHIDVSWADNARGRGPIGLAIRTGQMQVVQDVSIDPRFEPWRANAGKLGYRAVLVAPLLSDGEAIGALSIYADSVNAFDQAEVALLGELASDTAFGIGTLRTRSAHEQSARRLQRSMEETVAAIAATVEMRDPYTAGHQRRVAELATAIARELQLPEERVRGIHLAGVVHDLGKIHVPAEIMSKPGRLSRIEFELIKSHPEAGYEILKGVDFPWPIAQIVLQHHERIDGSGYPRGLQGDAILLEARILAVADVVEAMASHRPYRASLGIEPALQEIGAKAGKYYDADAVRACLALFREKGFVLQG